jgi:putative inorganic carbon (HCO3(-)) transporter
MVANRAQADDIHPMIKSTLLVTVGVVTELLAIGWTWLAFRLTRGRWPTNGPATLVEESDAPRPVSLEAQHEDGWVGEPVGAPPLAGTSRRPVSRVRRLLQLIWRERLRLAIGITSVVVAWVIGAVATLEVSPIKLLVAVAGSLALPIVLLHVDLGILLLLAILWGRVSDVAVASYGAPSIATPLTILLAVGWVGQKLLRERRLSWSVLSSLTPVAAYLVVASMSLLWTEDVASTWDSLVILVKDVAIFWVVAEIVSTYRLIRPAALALVLTAGVLAIIGIHQYATGDYQSSYGGFAQSAVLNIVGDVDSYRLGGPMNSPNAFANILLLTIPLGMAVLRTWKSMYGRALLIGLLGVTCLAVLLTYSRSGLLLLGLVVALSLPRHRIHTWHVLLAVVVLPLAIWFAPARVWDRAGTLIALVIGSGESGVLVDESVELRLGAQVTALEIFFTHPFLGSGVGTYPILYQNYSRWLGLRSLSTEYASHNQYLEVLAETGIAGLLTFGTMLILPLMKLQRARALLVGDDPDTHQRREMLYGVAIAYVGYLAAVTVIHAAYPRFFWILLALTVAAGRTGVAARSAPAAAVLPPVPDMELNQSRTRRPAPYPIATASPRGAESWADIS